MNRISTNKGFSLIEMIVVVAILGIIAALALPSYQRYLEDGYIEQGKSTLLQDAQFMARWYIDHGSYAGVTNLPAKDANSNFYTYNLVAGSLTDSTFKIKATPTAANTSKKNLVIDQDGALQSCTESGESTACTKI